MMSPAPAPRLRRALAAAAGGLAVLAFASAPHADLVLYNHSTSLPPGLYIRTNGGATRTAIVTVRAAEVAPAYARMRDFTAPGDRFIKRVAAIGGESVCASGDAVTLDRRIVLRRQARDSAGRLLPRWSGCRTLGSDEILLLGDTPDSFDGRYWGPISRKLIEGVWRPLRIDPAWSGGLARAASAGDARAPWSSASPSPRSGS
jgi:conjugative transfer signal peptidase TraF